MNPAAELGKLSWEKRKKGKSKKQVAEMMRQLALKRHAKLDTPSV